MRNDSATPARHAWQSRSEQATRGERLLPAAEGPKPAFRFPESSFTNLDRIPVAHLSMRYDDRYNLHLPEFSGPCRTRSGLELSGQVPRASQPGDAFLLFLRRGLERFLAKLARPIKD